MRWEGDMPVVARRMQRFVRLLGFLAAVPILAVLPDVADRSGCDRIPGWVHRHQAQLPTSLTGLSEYAPAFRQAIFVALPAETQASIMTEHLTWFSSTEARLTLAQRRFVVDNFIPFV